MKITIISILIIITFGIFIYFLDNVYNTPEAIKARAETQIARDTAAEARAAQREKDRIENERIAAEIEAAKTPEQRQRERDAKAAEELDANTISVPEYIGLKLIGF